VAKSKRSNFLIDKPFQLGFIFRYLVIIILTIILVLAVIAIYYWVVSNIGEYKLNTSITYVTRGIQKSQGKQIFDYGKEKIYVIEEMNDSGNIVYKCYKAFSSEKYKPGDVVENISKDDLNPVIGPVTRTTTRFKIVIFPLILTCVFLIVIISIYSLFFSHRMAGPIYRIRVSLDRILQKDYDFKIKVRKTDFYVNIVEQLEKLRQQIAKK
jgi:hypothetical protein